MADFQAHQGQFAEKGITVYAVSTDDETHARETVARHGLTFPVLFGVDGRRLSETWGSYYESERDILQATSFVLSPGGRIVHAAYSTGPVSRLVPGDAIGLVTFAKQKG